MATRNDKVLAELDGTDDGKNDGIGIETVSPNAIDGQPTADSGDSGTTPKRGRGRPAGTTRKSNSGNSGSSRNSTAKSQAKNSGNIGIEQILYSIHMMMAGATKIEELKLSPEEAKQLANAVAEVNSHYNVAIDPKVMAWVGLTTTCVSIYAPRVASYKIRSSFEEKKRKASEKPVAKVEAPQKGLQPDSEALPMSVGIPT